MKQENTCLLCGTSCVGCSGGRCRGCSFNKKQVAVSNYFVRLGLDLTDSAFVQSFKQLVRDNKSIEEISALLEVEEGVIEAKELPVVGPKRQPTIGGKKYCVYPRGTVNVWDTCIYCGQSRFYGQGKPCIFLSNKGDELQENK